MSVTKKALNELLNYPILTLTSINMTRDLRAPPTSMRPTLATKIRMDMIELAKKHVSKAQFIKVVYIDSLDADKLLAFKSKYAKDPVSIRIQSSKLLPSILLNPRLKHGRVAYYDAQGLWKLVFSDETVLYYASWISNQKMQSMLAGTNTAIKNYLLWNQEIKKKDATPQFGIYTLDMDNFGGDPVIRYTPKKIHFRGQIYHESLPVMKADISDFFDNPGEYAKFGQPAFRKGILIGPPGTGKTSIAGIIAKLYQDMTSVVFSSNWSAVARHMMLCARFNVRTIIIMDDCEAQLSHASSDLLNFLSGTLTPKIKNGAYLILSTNDSMHIEWRILGRPGRIDKIIQVDNLKGKLANKCAQMYFGKTYKVNGQAIFENMSGAEIQELAYSCKKYANSIQVKIDDKLIKTVIKANEEAMNNAKQYSIPKTVMGGDLNKSVGFEMPSASSGRY